MQKLIFLRIGLVLNLLEDAVGRLARSSPIYRKNDRKVLLITVRSTTLDAFYWDSLYVTHKSVDYYLRNPQIDLKVAV